MPRNENTRPSSHSRASIASVAARLIAEEGIADFHLAKRKAARQLGLPEHTQFPDNAEVEAELRAYQALYQGDEQTAHLLLLRELAIEVMEMLAGFRPYLTGSVLDGTAGCHSSVDLLLFADSAKEVEIFLLNQGIDVEHEDKFGERVEAVLRLAAEDADVRLVIMAPNQERVSFRGRDGRQRERARVEAVRALLVASEAV